MTRHAIDTKVKDLPAFTDVSSILDKWERILTWWKKPTSLLLSCAMSFDGHTERLGRVYRGIIHWVANGNPVEILGAYHLAKKSGNFGLRSNGKAIFRKIFSEIVDNLQR